MGAYQKDLTLILELLQAGIDPDQGLQMFLQADANKTNMRQARKQAEAEALADQQAQMQEGLQTLIKTTVENAGEEGATPQALMAQFNALAGAYGLPEGVQKKAFAAVEPVLGNISMWDADDDAQIQEWVGEAKSRLGTGKDINRSDVREYVKSKAVSALGPEMFAQVAPQFHQSIDNAYFDKFSGPKDLDYEEYLATQQTNQAQALQQRLKEAQSAGKGFARFNQQRVPVTKLEDLTQALNPQSPIEKLLPGFGSTPVEPAATESGMSDYANAMLSPSGFAPFNQQRSPITSTLVDLGVVLDEDSEPPPEPTGSLGSFTDLFPFMRRPSGLSSLTRRSYG